MENTIEQKSPLEQIKEPIVAKPPFYKQKVVISTILFLVLLVFLLSSVFLFLENKSKNQSQKTTIAPVTQKHPNPTIDPTANWNTYDGKYFIFKYPSAWTEEISTSEKSDPKNIEVIRLRINVSIFGVKYIQSNFEKSTGFLSSDSNQITVGGRKAIISETKGTDGSPLPQGYSIISVNVKGEENTSYSIYFNGDRKEFSDSLINQILSTFKFINQNHTNILSEEIRNSVLVFGNNGTTLLKGLDSKPVVIAKDSTASNYSSVLSKIVYIKMDVDNNIYVYDVKTEKTEVIKTKEERLRDVVWSPDGKYLLTDSGTSNLGSGAVYTYPEGKLITTFPTISRSLDGIKWLWINNNEFVSIKQYSNPSPEPVEGGEWIRGITRLTLPGAIEKELVIPSNSDSYQALAIDKNTIFYRDSLLRYWQINTDGSSKKQINQLDVPTEKIISTIRENLPSEYAKSQITQYEVVQNRINPKWVVFTVFNNTGKICVMNLDNPKQTFKIITDGDDPSW